MEGLPFLPGYTIQDPSKCQFNLPHSLGWRNGYPVAKKPHIGIGGEPLVTQSVLYSHSVDLIRYDPSLTYGRTKNYVPPKFLPHFLLYSNKCLTFRAFFKQTVVESPDENYRVRIVNIIYFLEDDSITVMEPKVENAGFPQGRIVKRARIPKNDLGEYWHWKDLNLGMDMEIYGIVYHICSCDSYTRAWLESQGVEMEAEERLPFDPYQLKRQGKNAPRQTVTPSTFDKMKKYMEYDRSVLRFYALWDDRMSEFGEMRKHTILYYLVDDTMDIIQEPRKDLINQFQTNTILKRTKVPKSWLQSVDYCPLIHERTDADVLQFYSPEDFICGKTIFLMGRSFYLYDCDEYTRKYYRKIYCIEQPRVELPQPSKDDTRKQALPPYNGFGTPEDSMLSYLYLDPLSVKRTNRDEFLRYVQNTNKKLRYTAVMEYVHPEDAGRQFIIEYRISDNTVMIHELRQRNSGFKGGRFLTHSLIPKPGTNKDNPEYYSPKDFQIGSVIEVYGHRFKITGVDLAVYRYMEANPEKFDEQMLADVRRHLTREGYLTEDIKEVAEYRRREDIAEPTLETPEEKEGRHAKEMREAKESGLQEKKVTFEDHEKSCS